MPVASADGSPHCGDVPACPETGRYGESLCPRASELTYMAQVALNTKFLLCADGAP